MHRCATVTTTKQFINEIVAIVYPSFFINFYLFWFCFSRFWMQQNKSHRNAETNHSVYLKIAMLWVVVIWKMAKHYSAVHISSKLETHRWGFVHNTRSLELYNPFVKFIHVWLDRNSQRCFTILFDFIHLLYRLSPLLSIILKQLTFLSVSICFCCIVSGLNVSSSYRFWSGKWERRKKDSFLWALFIFGCFQILTRWDDSSLLISRGNGAASFFKCV